MKKLLTLILVLGAFVSSMAQTPMYIKNGTGTAANTIPFNQASQKTQLLYTPADFTTAPSSGFITKLYFRNSVAAATGTFTNFEVNFKQVSNTSFPSTSFFTGMTSALTAASFTITGNATAGGWFEIPLPSPYYTYNNTQTLIVEIQYSAKTGGLSTYNTVSTGNKRCSGTSQTATTGTTNTTWNDFGMDIAPATACTTPPTAGATTSSATGGVCAGSSVNIGLTGNSSGSGQSYQLQSATTATGTYTNVGAPSTVSSTTAITATASLWYRYELTCGTTSSVSTPVQVVVNPLFAGGTYTINSASPTGGTNFQTFNAAVNAMACGISGPIIFNVSPGTYSEQVIIPNIPTSSASNTITFNGNGATLTYPATLTGERATLKLNGADYIRVNNLKIIATGATYGIGVHLTDDADNNIINGCFIYTDTTATGSGFAGISISGAASSTATASDCDSNTISNNIINGGYYSITVLGNGTTSRISKNRITGNTITNFYYYGIYLNGTDNVLVDSNDISRPTRSNNSVFYPMYLTTGVLGANISRNRIHNSNDGEPGNTSAQYGIYISADGTTAKPNVVSNNLIYNINGAGAAYGLYKSGGDTAKIYHNTISLDYQFATAPSTVVYGYYQTAVHYGLDFSNNIISISRNSTGSRYCIYIATATATYKGNGNAFNLSGTSGTSGIGYYSGSAAPTLTDWRSATGQDAASVAADPFFISMSTGNFKPSASLIDNIGLPVGITSDITGAARSTTTPDPGAYEFVAGGCVSPPTPGTATSSATGGVCPGTIVTIGLTSNSIGSGQTYQLQSSATATGTYTNIGASLVGPTSTVTIATSQWYRYAVTCGTSTVNSTPVQVVVNPLFAGGNYTINSAVATGGTNFQTFNAAVNAMICGIGGPVTFNVVAGSGPYNEQVIIPTISGASSVNRITFNGNAATLTYGATITGERATVKLNGADYITINNLKIIATGGTYGVGVQMLDDADNNTISGCSIYTDTTATGTGFAGISISGSATSSTTANSNCDSISLINNIVNGGYYGITMLGNGTTAQITGNRIVGNTVSNFYYYGIYLNGNDGLLVEGNDITRPTRSNASALQGIYLTTGCIGLTVSKNRIHNASGGELTNTSVQYGIYISADGTALKPNVIVNNAIYDINGAGIAYGIYKTGADYITIHHNTISMDYMAVTPATTAVYGFYQTAVHSGLDFSDNMVTVGRNSTGVRYCVYVATATATFTGNYNNYFVKGASGTSGIGYYAGAPQITLSAWASATSQDANSWSLDPIYVSLTNGNLKPTNMLLDNKGANVGITTDILNETRISPPDIGAFEFGSDCQAASNLAVSALTGISATISWNAVTGAQGYEYVLDQVNSNPTVPAATITTASYNASGLSPLTTYYFHVRIKCPAGGTSYWNTISFTTLCNISVAKITASGDTIICPNAPITLSADTGANLTYQWSLNGTPIPSATAKDYVTATPGSYTVTETMGTCTKTSDTLHVVVDTRLVANVTFSGSSTICEGSSITLQANTGAGFQYQWYRDNQPMADATHSSYVAEYNGSYTVRITSTAAPCPAVSNPVVVVVNNKPVPQITRTGNVLYTTVPYATYQWYKGTQPIPGATAATYTIVNDANFSVIVTDGNNCTGQSSAYPVNFLSIGQVPSSAIAVYPNPASQVVHISSPVPVSAAITSMDGKTVLYEEHASDVDIHQLSEGIYLLYIRDSNNAVLKIEKLVKAK